MKKYTIELNDDLATIYEDLAVMNNKSTEESIQNMLKRVIDILLSNNS